MPLIIKLEFVDGTSEIQRIPAEIWKVEHKEVKKVFITEKEVKRIVLDPFLETADTNTENNYFPREQQMNQFEMFKNRSRGGRENPMQKDKRAKEKAAKKSSGTD